MLLYVELGVISPHEGLGVVAGVREMDGVHP